MEPLRPDLLVIGFGKAGKIVAGESAGLSEGITDVSRDQVERRGGTSVPG
jgi:pyruvate/2-oxoglutarate dehydrogenase complex dihydrolipoamide dehydrogenase (E3) component